MDALDCPAGDKLTAVRDNTVTVQQALAMWNNVFIARHAGHFAARLAATPGDDAGRIALACEIVWGRAPHADEARELAEYSGTHGMANLCRLLFNSNEAMFVE